MLTAGHGTPLVYFHGAGTVTRFDFAEPWTREHEVVIPYHPGFGESADDPAVTEIHDYVLHYLELFDRARPQARASRRPVDGRLHRGEACDRARLSDREARARVPDRHSDSDVPTTDFLKLPPQELPALLGVDPQTVIKHLPAKPSDAFIAERVKETVTATRLIGTAAYDTKLPRYLHRLTMPTLLVWGKQDQLTPTAQHRSWAKLLPRAQVKLFDGGHLVLDEAPASVTAIKDFLRG